MPKRMKHPNAVCGYCHQAILHTGHLKEKPFYHERCFLKMQLPGGLGPGSQGTQMEGYARARLAQLEGKALSDWDRAQLTGGKLDAWMKVES